MADMPDTKGVEGAERFHPLADAFPLMKGAEFGELIADIDNNGLLTPVVMYQGKILDGRNRWRACQKLGLAHTERQFTGEDPAAYVWSVNAVRRQLTPSQKAMAATKLITARHGDNVNTLRDKVTTAQAAKLAGVSPKSIERAKVVVAGGVPEVQDAVESGEVTVYTAQRIAQLDPGKQAELMATTDPADLSRAVPEMPNARKPKRALSSVPAPLPEDGEDAPVKGPGRGYVGPVTQLTRQLEAYSPEGAKLRVKQWAEHRELINEIDGGQMDQFIRDLKTEKKAIDQLVRLIKIERDRVAALAKQGENKPEQEK